MWDVQQDIARWRSKTANYTCCWRNHSKSELKVSPISLKRWTFSLCWKWKCHWWKPPTVSSELPLVGFSGFFNNIPAVTDVDVINRLQVVPALSFNYSFPLHSFPWSDIFASNLISPLYCNIRRSDSSSSSSSLLLPSSLSHSLAPLLSLRGAAILVFKQSC